MIIEIPENRKGPLIQNMLATFWMSTVTGFIKLAGTEKSMELMGPMLHDIGISKAQSMLRGIPPLEPNALGFAKWTNSWEDMMGIEGDFEMVSPERVVKVISKCPFAEQEGNTQIMCDLFSCTLNGAATIISPGFVFKQTHGLLNGDKYCRWVIERSSD